VQVRDEYGNAVEEADIPVSISLEWASSASGDVGELPSLELAEGRTQRTDGQGRVFYGDVSIAEGSGRADVDENGAPLEMLLSFTAGPER
jgi:hypothetical protein